MATATSALSSTLLAPSNHHSNHHNNHHQQLIKSKSFSGLRPLTLTSKPSATATTTTTTGRRRSMTCRAELNPSVVISLSTGLSLFLGRFVFFNFQRENVAKQIPSQNGQTHFEAGDVRAKEYNFPQDEPPLTESHEDANSPESDEETIDNDKKRKKTSTKRSKSLGEVKRKKKSKWWEHFETDEEDPTYARCKYCRARIGCDTKNGTTPLANHTKRCKKYPPNVLVFVAVILDPRHKMNYVDWIVRYSYDETKATLLSLKIKMALQSLYDVYSSTMNPPKPTVSSSSTSTSSTILSQGGMQIGVKFDLQQIMASQYERDTGCSLTNANKSELEKYLDDACEPNDSNFEILQWWKDQSRRYPTLQKMARDVLAIPISTVASESAFSTGGRVLDDFRTSLTPKMVEALVCTQDWLRTSHSPIIVEENLLALEELEEGMKDLTLEQPDIIIDETINTMEDY